MALTLIWIIQLLYIRKKFHDLSEDLDQSIVTASDFTALLYNMPNDQGYDEDEVKKLVEQYYEVLKINNLKADVAKVNIAYEIEEYTGKLNEYMELMRQLRAVQIEEAAGSEPSLTAE